MADAFPRAAFPQAAAWKVPAGPGCPRSQKAGAGETGVVEAAEQLDEGGLAAAVLADDGEPAPDLEGEVHMPQRPAIRPRVFKRDVLKLDLILPVGALFGRQAPLVHLVGDVEELKTGRQRIGIQLHQV